MKLHTDRNEVERSNVGSESQFRIKTTAKAFDILSKSLYTDHVLAVVRELSCNAYDAHVSANNPDPFEIHIPNSLEPWFHVKDNGTGLSDEDVMNLYSTYFDSTKTSSNDFIGALGLGSKSPFSYTKAFEVISRHDHVRRTYSVFINEEGVPTIAKMGEFVTDEHNGLEVRVTVKKSDFWEFQSKVSQALRYFPVKPKIVGTDHFEWPTMPKKSLSGAGWAMFDDNYSDGYSKMTAVQGNVAYKVDITKLNLKDSERTLLENCHIVGFFDIGELEVAASREEIRYDDRSSAALVKRVKDVCVGILKSIEERVVKIENEGATLWTVMVLLKNINNEIICNNKIFNEFLLSSKLPSIKWYLETGGTLRLPDLYGHAVSGYSLSSSGDPGKAAVRRSHYGSGIDPDESTVVFFNDLKSGGVAKIVQYLRTKAWTTINSTIAPRSAIVIRKLDKPNVFEKPVDGQTLGKQIEWTDAEYKAEFDKILAALGNVEIKLASTDGIFPPRGRSGIYGQLPIFQFEKINARRYGKSTISWKRVPTENLDMTKDCLYFFIRNGAHITVIDQKGEERDVTWDVMKTQEYLENALKLINSAQGTKYTFNNLYAVGSMVSKKIKKLPNWVNLFDALKTQMDQFKPAVEYFKRIQMTSNIMGLCSAIISNRGYRNEMIDRLKKLDNDSTFKKVLMPFVEDTLKYENMSVMCSFVQKLDVDLGTKIFDNPTPKGYFTEKAFESYPMLTFVNQYHYLDRKQQNLFFDYIETIDRS